MEYPHPALHMVTQVRNQCHSVCVWYGTDADMQHRSDFNQEIDQNLRFESKFSLTSNALYVLLSLVIAIAQALGRPTPCSASTGLT